MGSGVATFDFDNDGRLDLFFVNGAPLADPTPKGTVPQKKSPADWNRLYHQKPDGTFEDVTEKAGLEGVGYGMGVAVGDYDNDGFEDLYVTSIRRKPPLPQRRQRPLHRRHPKIRTPPAPQSQAKTGPPPPPGSISTTTASSTSSSSATSAGTSKTSGAASTATATAPTATPTSSPPSRRSSTTTTATAPSPKSPPKLGLNTPGKGLGHRPRRLRPRRQNRPRRRQRLHARVPLPQQGQWHV